MKYLLKYPIRENKFPFKKEEDEETEKETEDTPQEEVEDDNEPKAPAKSTSKPAAKSTFKTPPAKSDFQQLSTDTEMSDNAASTIKLNSATLEPESNLSDEGSDESEPSSTIKLEKEPGDEEHQFSDDGTDGSAELEKDANLVEKRIISFFDFIKK